MEVESNGSIPEVESTRCELPSIPAFPNGSAALATGRLSNVALTLPYMGWGLGLGRTAECGNVVTRTFKRIVAGYKSLPGIVVRAIVATLLGTGDLVSDLYTTVNLYSLSHLSPAYAMVAMICASMAAQVRASSPVRGSRDVSLSLVSWRLWPHVWLRRRYWPSS